MSTRTFPPLPDAWVDRLIGRMAVRYGEVWSRMWLGLDPKLVRADWANELAGLHLPERQHRLQWALENLPGQPLNARQFRDLTRQAPEPVQQLPQLPAPSEHVREQLLALRDGLRQIGTAPPRQWAHRLLDRHKAGEHIATPATLDMARSTLRARRDELAVSEYQSPRDHA